MTRSLIMAGSPIEIMKTPRTCRGLKRMNQKNNESTLRTDACCRPAAVTGQGQPRRRKKDGHRQGDCRLIQFGRCRTPRLLFDHILRWPDIICQPQRFETADDIPPDVNLPPAATKTRRVGVGMMVLV